MEITRCRVKRSYWWMPAMIAGIGVSSLFGPSTMPPEQTEVSLWIGFLFFSGFAVAAFFGAITMVASLLREEIIADEIGLRWRGAFGAWKSARWEEISDFYLEKWKRTPTIETPYGKLKIIPELAHHEAMLELIARCATSTPAREWEMEHLRAHQNFSKRFSYWTKSQKWLAPILSLGSLYVLGYFGWATAFSSFSTLSPRYRFTGSSDWLSILMIVVQLGPVALLMIASPAIAWRDRRFAARHRQEWVEISPRGLAWQNGKKRIEANWDEVRAISPKPGGGFKLNYRVETANGDFTVWKELDAMGLWLQLARQFAPDIAPEAHSSSVELGGERATWSGGKAGIGARIFHFRTSEARTVLWCITFLPPVAPLLPLLMHAFKLPEDDASTVPYQLCAAALFTVVAAIGYVWLCFARAALWADETGLEWRVPLWKTRRVAWSEIESFGRDEAGFFIRTRARKRKLWQISAPVRKEELLQLIAQRATNATGKWD